MSAITELPVELIGHICRFGIFVWCEWHSELALCCKHIRDGTRAYLNEVVTRMCEDQIAKLIAWRGPGVFPKIGEFYHINWKACVYGSHFRRLMAANPDFGIVKCIGSGGKQGKHEMPSFLFATCYPQMQDIAEIWVNVCDLAFRIQPTFRTVLEHGHAIDSDFAVVEHSPRWSTGKGDSDGPYARQNALNFTWQEVTSDRFHELTPSVMHECTLLAPYNLQTLGRLIAETGMWRGEVVMPRPFGIIDQEFAKTHHERLPPHSFFLLFSSRILRYVGMVAATPNRTTAGGVELGPRYPRYDTHFYAFEAPLRGQSMYDRSDDGPVVYFLERHELRYIDYSVLESHAKRGRRIVHREDLSDPGELMWELVPKCASGTS